jgi:broad-specificity NMP kinase
MKLLILYGSPATGKFTVAKELSKMTGYPLFHNHMVADLASSIFPFGTKGYSDLSSRLRLVIVARAVKNRLPGMIVTFTYGVETFKGKRDNVLLKQMSALVKNACGKAYFIKFSASNEALKKRLTDPSRKKFKKLTSYNALQKLRAKYRMDAAVPFTNSISVKTTAKSPRQTAKLIVKNISSH